MSRMRVFFHRCHQDSQDFGSDTEHMVSRIFFSIEANGERRDGLHVDIKQAVGSPFEAKSIEVGFPANYKGPFDHNAFRKAIGEYYLLLVGPKGAAIRFAEGTHSLRMSDNIIIHEAITEFDADSSSASW